MALCSGLLLAQLVGFRNKPHPGRGGPVLLVSGRSDDPRILVSSSLCKDGSSWGPETCGTGAGHESRTFLQADEVARHQCCVYWVVLSFCICLYCFWSVGWDGIASANKWHRVPVPDCKALMFIDVVCLCGPATHSSWRSLMDHIISHQSISTCPHWNQGGKRHWTCYWLELPLLFMYFGYLNWTGQGRRTGPQSRSGVGNTSMAPFQTLFTGLFKHTFYKYKYTINIYIYLCNIYIYIYNLILFDWSFSSQFRSSDSYWQLFSPFPTVLALLPYSLWWSSRYHKSRAFFGRCPRPFSEASAMRAQSLALSICWTGSLRTS